MAASGGMFTCEVVTTPDFDTKSDSSLLNVVRLPTELPEVRGHERKARYYEGDILSISCVSEGGMPAPNITWLINNGPVRKKALLYKVGLKAYLQMNKPRSFCPTCTVLCRTLPVLVQYHVMLYFVVNQYGKLQAEMYGADITQSKLPVQQFPPPGEKRESIRANSLLSEVTRSRLEMVLQSDLTRKRSRSSKGRVKFKCISSLYDIYHRSNEVSIETVDRESLVESSTTPRPITPESVLHHDATIKLASSSVSTLASTGLWIMELSLICVITFYVK